MVNKMIFKNYKGEYIIDKPELIKPEYGKIGNPDIPDYQRHKQPMADDAGFDMTKTISGTDYKIEAILPKGTIILRYGTEIGRYTAPDDTPYEQLALPYKQDTIEFHKYRVIANNIKVKCVVVKGYVAPCFDQPGGGIQYLHEQTIRKLLFDEVIERLI